jgi:Rrf2 family protein
MKLSRAACHALHALAYIAGQPPGPPVTSNAIAATEGTPPGHLKKVLGLLESAGILRSVRGPGGGYLLAGPLQAVTLLEVVEAVDGPVRSEVPTDFATAKDGLDGRLGKVCQGVAELVRARLAKVRLSELVKG